MSGDGDKRKEPPRLPDSSREIARWESRGDTIKVELQRYGQAEVVAIRRWFPTDDGLRPGRSGMSFGADELDKLTVAIEEARLAMRGNGTVAASAHVLDPQPPVPASARPSVVPLPRGTGGTVAKDVSPPASDIRTPVQRRVFLPPRIARPAAVRGPTVVPEQLPVDPPVRPAPAAAAPSQAEHPRANGATVHDIAAARPSAPPPAELPVGPRDRTGVTLTAIIAKKLVRAPLALRIKTRQGTVSGVAYEDGNIVFGNRRFRSPREAYCAITGQQHVVDAWQRITYRNPVTQRFAKLSRLRNLYLGLEEEGGDTDDE